MNWKHRDYALNPEHPPLVKLVAALPLLPLSLKVAPREGRYFKSESYYGGRELLFRNDPRYGGKYAADTLLFRVHMAVLVFRCLLQCFSSSQATKCSVHWPDWSQWRCGSSIQQY